MGWRVAVGVRCVGWRLVDGPVDWSCPELAGGGGFYAAARDIDVCWYDIGSCRAAPSKDGGSRGGTDPNIGVDHEVSGASERKYEAFDKLDGELAWVGGLLDVVVLYVRENPEVTWVLPFGVAGVLPHLGSPIVLLAGVFLRDTYGVKVKEVLVALGEPKDGFISA